MSYDATQHRTRTSRPMPKIGLGPPISTQFGRSIDQLASLPPPPSTGGGGGASVILPFKITDTSPDAVTPTVNVVYGTVMDIEPTDVATDISLTADATNTLYLDATIDDDGLVTAVDLLVGTSGRPADTTYHAYLLIGEVTVDIDGLITLIEQSLYFSQGFKACDRDPADPATTPGTYQFFVR